MPVVWMAEHRSFHMKFWGSVLLDEMNNSTMADLDFNGLIRRSVVGKPNPKNLTKCVFPWKKL